MDVSSYDEDLSQNPFFQAVQKNYPQLLERAISEGWIVCVPRCGTFDKDCLAESDILGQILVPDDELPGTHFHTLSERHVRLNNQILVVEYDKVGKTCSFPIVFKETFYTEDLYKYSVWCIEGLLEQEPSNLQDRVKTIASLKDCVDFLWAELQDKNLIKEIDFEIEEFEKSSRDLHNAALDSQRDLVAMLYNNCFQILLKEKALEEKTIENKHYLYTVKVAIETYLLHGLRKILLEIISMHTATQDAKLNKIIKNSVQLQLNDLGIRQDLFDGVLRAKLELSRINNYFTVLGKIECLKRVMKCVSEGELSVSSDDLLPVLIFLVVKSGIGNWYSQICFMKTFRYSVNSENETDEVGFLITSLEAAVEHINSGSLDITIDSILHSKNPKHTEPKTGDEEVSDEYRELNIFFEIIKSGNLEEVTNTLFDEKKCPNKQNEFCHPLCLCENCKKNSLSACDANKISVNSKDERGQTPLHVACFYGQVAIVDFILQNGGDPCEPDGDGISPIHIACLKGHQSILLLLLHANVNPNITDFSGNTPLHLAADYGHDKCAKTLLYFSKQSKYIINVNLNNIHGDSPLHFASKWGFIEIVQILLEYGANVISKNKRGQTPLSLAHNIHIKHILERYIDQSNHVNNHIAKNGKLMSLQNVKSLPNLMSIPKSKESKRLTDGLHKIDKLFMAIAEGDIWLASYYLGLDGPSSQMDSKKEGFELCHPLCNCEKCISIEEIVFEKETKAPVAINAVNSKGETALHIACMEGQTDIIELLLDAGAKVNLATRSEGRTPLHLACMNNKMSAVKMLLNSGACNIDAKDHNRDTPLHLASRAGHCKIVEMLIRNGANTKLYNLNGSTPIEEVEKIRSNDIFYTFALTNTAKILKNIAIN